MSKKNQLKRIRTGVVMRSLTLARTGLRASGLMAKQALKGALSKDSNYNEFIKEQLQILTEELGQLKGSMMKVGQLLSTYGEHFFPKEANEILKKLQFQSPPLSWPAVEKVLFRELGQTKLHELEIDKNPYASASIGQVHRAVRKSDGLQMVLKIQYPGVDRAIDTDLRFLKAILAVGPLLPKGPRFDQIFSEVRTMLHQEVDYRIELQLTQKFADLLKDEPTFRVPKVFEEYSTAKVLATEYLPGVPADSLEVAHLPLERRNRLGEAYLRLYLRELTEFRAVQTDPHLGNYRVEIDPSGGEDRLILLDFGAVREVPDTFLIPYRKVILGGVNRDRELIIEGGRELGLLQPDDPSALVDRYVELCLLITEPFHGIDYDWGNSDLPKRVAKKASELVFGFHLRAPPRELVFLDRKLGGAFVFLSVLRCQADFRQTFQLLDTVRSRNVSL